MNVDIDNDWPRCEGFQVSPRTALGMAYSTLAPIPARSRLAIKRPVELLKPETVFHRMKKQLDKIHTGRRPKTSERGASTMGPKAKARTKMERKIWALAWDVPRSLAMAARAGAIIVLAMSVTRPPRDRRRVRAHFRGWDQL